ncbi:MAG: hypothetical protein REJ50_18615, partial [Bordetella sp.]|nr:hypothetical protein [Bordetella sp.]
MAGLAGCVRILVVEQLREPLGVFWSFVAPIGYIVASATIHGTPRLLAEAYLDQAAWGLAYVALMVACNGFGLYLVGR